MSKQNQPQRYLIIGGGAHWIGGRLVYPDRGEQSIVTLEDGIEPGRWLQPLDAKTEKAVKEESKLPDQFAIKHGGTGVGVGNWSVERISDGSRASVIFKKADGDAKAKAEAEAKRLNEGGAIDLGSKDAESSSTEVDQVAQPASEPDDSGFPDA